MNTSSYKTKSATEKDIKRAWYLVDARGEVLGRMASRIASILKGKNKAYFTPHMDCGDYIVVLNAGEVKLTGNKWTDKEYLRHTGYPGGQRSTSPKEIAAKHPERIIENAVKGMLPKNKLGRAMYKKLFVYTGNEHPHQSQKPEKLKI